MSKIRRGRPRVFAKREKNGQPQRVRTLEQIQAAEQSARLAEQSVVLNQPHRRNAKDPRSTLLVTALGRYADKVGLPVELLQAGIDYQDLWRRYMALADIPGAAREPSEYGSGDDPEEADQRRAEALVKAKKFLLEVEHGAARRDQAGFVAARHLIIDDIDIPGHMWVVARAGLYALALELGIIEQPRIPSLTRFENRASVVVINS